MYVILVALFLSILWGTTPVVHKYVLRQISPMTLMIVGGLFYLLGISVLSYLNKGILRRDIAKMDAATWVTVAVVTLLSLVLGNYLYFTALEREKSHIIAALVSTYPLITFAIAAIVLKEPVSTRSIIGAVLIVIGIYLLSTETRSQIK